MRAVAVYNMKGGVGKTTTAVNLAYLAAAAGERVLLWDLDPQAASSFAYRVRPRVAGFGKKSLERAETLSAAIKETDYGNLDLLPADFAYRKFDRLLNHLGKPERVVTALFDALGRDYDLMFLDCPAGFSLLTEGVFAAADAVLMPTIPTPLSLRTVARAIKWADRSDSPSQLAAFFNMVDRRKTLHRRACEWSSDHPEVFLAASIPYASVVEQMAARRMPLSAFAPRDAATTGFAEIWSELQARLERREGRRPGQRERWMDTVGAIESLIAELQSADAPEPRAASHVSGIDLTHGAAAAWSGDHRERSATKKDSSGGDAEVVHSFDTEDRDLQRSGYVLELREHTRRLLVVAARCGSDVSETTARAQAQIDSSWALQILSGEMSPLTALEQRLGRPGPRPVEDIRAVAGRRRLWRIESQMHLDRGDERDSADMIRLPSFEPGIARHWSLRA